MTETTDKRAGCAAAMIIFFVIAIVGFSMTHPFDKADDGADDAGLACVMAEKLIKSQLKAPSTAEFDYADCKQNAVQSGHTWLLHSYIDADNSFGAHIRTYYSVEMSNTPPSDIWHMNNLRFHP